MIHLVQWNLHHWIQHEILCHIGVIQHSKQLSATTSALMAENGPKRTKTFFLPFQNSWNQSAYPMSSHSVVSTTLISLVAFIISPLTIAATATASSVSISIETLSNSHISHTSPHLTTNHMIMISSVYSSYNSIQYTDNTTINRGDESSLFDIDESSTRLDDIVQQY